MSDKTLDIKAFTKLFRSSIQRRWEEYFPAVSNRNIILNILWLFFDRFFRLGLGLFVGVWVARYLGPQEYGLYNYAGAFVGLLAPIAYLGLDTIVVKELVNHSNSKNSIMGSVFFLRLGGSFIALILVVISSGLLSSDPIYRLITLIIASCFFFQTLDTIDLWFQSQVRSKNTVIAKNSAFFIASIFKIILILSNQQVVLFAIAWLFECILGAIFLSIAYIRSKGNLFAWTYSTLWIKKLLKQSWPLILSGFAITIYMKIDQVMLGTMLGEKAVGIYSAAIRISEIWYFIPVGIVSSVSPSIMALKKEHEKLYYHRLQSVLNFLVLFAYIICISMTVFSKEVITILYGNEYLESYKVLIIHIWQGVFVFMGVVRGIWIVAEGLTKSTLLTMLIGAVANILLNFFLIPPLGPIGSAWATLLSYGLSDYLIFILIPYPPFRVFGRMMTKALLLEFLWPKFIRRNDISSGAEG